MWMMELARKTKTADSRIGRTSDVIGTIGAPQWARILPLGRALRSEGALVRGFSVRGFAAVFFGFGGVHRKQAERSELREPAHPRTLRTRGPLMIRQNPWRHTRAQRVCHGQDIDEFLHHGAFDG